jgi:flagellar biosynthesis protein FliQ
MKGFFNGFVAFMAHIKAFFKPYDEELMNGLDVESLLKRPSAKDEIETKIRENTFFHQQQKEEYERFMNEFVIIDRIDKLEMGLKNRFLKLCRQYSELIVLREDAGKIREEAKKKEHPAVHDFVRDIPKAIKILKEHEDNQQKVKNDLAILEGERDSLSYQFTNLKRTSIFLRYFMLGLVFVSFLVGVILAILLINEKADIFIPSIISIITISFLFIWGFVFQRYCHHEMKKNQMMQERAIKLINKTKIKFVRHQQVLDYEYVKYKVNSSEVLELRYENYLDASEKERNFVNISNRMNGVVIDIDRFMEKQHLENVDFVLRNADYFATLKGISTLKNNYQEERQSLQLALSRIEHEQQVLQNLLTNHFK